MKPQTTRHEVTVSLPRYCPLCAGGRVMGLVRVERIRGAGRVLCPHCVGVRGSSGDERIPVRNWPYRTDTPRGTA
ncbi:hypothetical protein [Pseudonocardia sp.]|uniref:hypothetical protein n=1 Tax=Pseudonocardia sp. TaxID=60912 RepID=UPI003D115BDD